MSIQKRGRGTWNEAILLTGVVKGESNGKLSWPVDSTRVGDNSTGRRLRVNYFNGGKATVRTGVIDKL